MELPFCSDPTFVIRNEAGRYTLLYDTLYRQAAWVAYLLTRNDAETRGADRTNAFRSDPEVVARGWPTATDRNYAKSGFDRGHLLPSADRNGAREENGATFYLSNVSPQRPGLNRCIWKSLEEQVRRWAGRYDSLYIVTGGELRPGLERIRGGVGVPEYFFKAVLVRYRGEWHAAAFLIPNAEQIPGRYSDYVLTVRRLEERLGYNLYCNLPDSIADRVEVRYELDFWK